MAVPARSNGLGEEEDDNGIFVEEEEDGGIIVEEETELKQVVIAVERGDVESLRQCLANLSSIDQPLEDGDTALHLSCLYGKLSCVELLLDKGASLEAKDEDGAIPLHDACAGGFIEIVRLLINRADPECVKRMLETVDMEGDTPLHHAARGEHAHVIKLLLDSGASPTKKNSFGKIPSELAEPDSEAIEVFERAANAMATY
ncbi:unnamed protein product [Cuscuta campestris]|uniref:Uncharacterized protein n=1 Tax=Cuscuta campestris TaxID=132261 RepID=A0A484K1P3_9ASTE|nr:unnamed protein product [Cuscuta campestris]